MNFGEALTLLQRGQLMKRDGWNGKEMFIELVNPERWHVDNGPRGCRHLPWIGFKTADDAFVPWVASQTDLLATDWSIL